MQAVLSMTYDGTDQSAVIIRGAGKIIGCLIAQSCRRGREEEEEEEGGGKRGRWSFVRSTIVLEKSGRKGRGRGRFHRLLIYALAALYIAAEKKEKN